jgi:hypothetical protein
MSAVETLVQVNYNRILIDVKTNHNRPFKAQKYMFNNPQEYIECGKEIRSRIANIIEAAFWPEPTRSTLALVPRFRAYEGPMRDTWPVFHTRRLDISYG